MLKSLSRFFRNSKQLRSKVLFGVVAGLEMALISVNFLLWKQAFNVLWTSRMNN